MMQLMMGYSGFGTLAAFWAILNMLVPVAVIGLVVWLIFRQQGTRPQGRSEPLRILQERYARGEISREEYREMKSELEQDR